MNSQEIVDILEKPTKDRKRLVQQLQKQESSNELREALKLSRLPLTRQILCDILGNRHDSAAINELLIALNDSSPNVRGSAADAIAKCGNASAGKPLIDRLVIEENKGTQQMLVLALGAVGNKAAIPYLIKLLGDSNATTRGCAAWSLGVLKAEESEAALKEALENEFDSYAKERIGQALVSIKKQGDS